MHQNKLQPKQGTYYSIILLVLGFIFEGIFLLVEDPIVDAKLLFLGAVCLIAGAIGLWITTINPWINNKNS